MSDEKLFWYLYDLNGKFDEPIRNALKDRPVRNYFVFLIMSVSACVMLVYVVSYLYYGVFDGEHTGIFTIIYWGIILFYIFATIKVTSIEQQELRTYRSERDMKTSLSNLKQKKQ